MKYLFVLLLLAGCATVQEVSLLPRGVGAKGKGTFEDRTVSTYLLRIVEREPTVQVFYQQIEGRVGTQ